MITEIYTSLKQNTFISAIKKIITSKWMMVAIFLLAAISNIFALEIAVYYSYLLLILITILFCDDMLPLLPIACCGYMTFAKKNNPMAIEQTSSFLNNSTLIHLLIIGITISIFVVFRISFELIKHPEKRKMPKLFYGFLLLGVSYVVGGLFSSYYDSKTAIFGFIQIIATSFTYFCFYYTVNWEKVDKNYFALLFSLIGGLMVIEVFNMLLQAGFFNVEGAFSRSKLYTGWGINNNIASICIFAIPAPFYFTLTKKNGWRYIWLSTLFLITTILTQSRNGMLMGTVIYSISAIVVLVKTKQKERLKNFLIFSFILLLTILFMVIFNDLIKNLFSSVYKAGTSDSGRINIYIDGLNQYLDNPIFGNGFYACQAFRWGVKTEGLFLPGRYHNTYVQILASCGTMGMLAYLYHRFQTVKLCITSRNPGATVITLTLMGFILISLFDCHFHNFGPGFIYSALLLLLEKVYNYDESKKKESQ